MRKKNTTPRGIHAAKEQGIVKLLLSGVPPAKIYIWLDNPEDDTPDMTSNSWDPFIFMSLKHL